MADVVVLQNGDKITGQIQKLESEKLALKTTYAGTIQIAWKEVAEVSTDTVLEVETDSGRLWRGIIQNSEDGIEVVDEDVSTYLPLLTVKSIATVPTEAREHWLEPLDGSLDLGYNLARGNSRLNQSSAILSARYRTLTYQIQMEMASLFANQVDTPATSRHNANLRYDRFYSPQRFTFLLANFERDERRRLNLRSNLGGGLGWTLIKNSRHEASLLAGLTLVNEQYRFEEGVEMVPRQSSGEGLLGLDLRNSIGLGAEFVNKFLLTPSLIQSGRYRFSIETGVRMPLLTRYVWSFQIFNRFDSEPPVEARRNDYGAISSFGVTF